MSDNYEDILSATWDEIPEVQTLPVGSWLLRGLNAKFTPAKSEDKNPYVMFVYSAQEAMSDVDDEAIAALGADYDIGENRIFHRVWIETKRDWDNVRKHLVKHGLEVEGGVSINDTLSAFKGSQVIAFLDIREFTNSAGELDQDNNATAFTAVS